MTRPRFPLYLGLLAACSAALWLASCSDETGPMIPIEGRLAVAPRFESNLAGIIDIRSIRFTLASGEDGSVAKDTVLQIEPGADSVVLELTVPILTAGEVFSLLVAMVDAAGDTVFRAGPVDVTPGTSGEPPLIPITLVYTGTGADAAAVAIGVDTARLFTGEAVVFQAVALDSVGEPIPGTPIGWRSLDTARATVPQPDSGRVVGGDTRGTARIVAELFNGPTDTADVFVQPLPASLVAVFGNGQSGTVGLTLPDRLEVRAAAADDIGTFRIWIQLTTTGGGTLSADSVRTGFDGRASVDWTLGPTVGTQTVEATTSRLPGVTATFTATAAAATGVVSWVSPVSGNWSDGAKWSTGAPPGPNDTVLVNVDGTYAVTLDVDATVKALEFGAATGNQAFQHGSQIFTVDSMATFGLQSAVLQDGGIFDGPGTIRMFGTFDWTDGSHQGGGVTRLEQGAVGVVSTLATKVLNNRTFETAGSLTWRDRGWGDFTTATLINEATGTVDLYEGRFTGSTGQFTNLGTVTVLASFDMDVPFDNAGSVAVNATMYAWQSVTHTGSFTTGPNGYLKFNANSTLQGDITGSGLVATGADITFNGAFSAGTYSMEQTGATVIFNGSFSVRDSLRSVSAGTTTFATGDTVFIPSLRHADGTLTGTDPIKVTSTFEWQGGSLAGSEVKILAGGASGMFSGVAKTLSGNYLHNEGTITWTGGNILFNTFGIINEPGGLFDIQDPANDGFGINLGTAFPGIENRGILRKSSGSGSTTIAPGLWNYGTIDIQAGMIRPATGQNQSFFHYDGAVIQGGGTINLVVPSTMGPINGDFNPGTSPGILSITGSLPQDTGSTINIELNGLTPGTQYDRLQMSGQAILTGDINITVGFSPAIGDSFTVMTYGSRIGSAVRAVNGLDLGGGFTLDTVWSANELALVVRGPPPGPIVFAGDSAGGLSTGLFSVNPDGTGRNRFRTETTLYDEYINPRWSPDKNRVAYTYRSGGFGFENQLLVTTVGLSPDSVATLVSDTSNYAPRYSPNGVHLAFVCGDGFSTIDVCVIGDVTGGVSTLNFIGNGAGKVYLTDFDIVNRNDGPEAFAWDPLNPDRIAFVRDSTNPLGGPTTSRIYTSLYDGTSLVALSADAMDLGAGPLQITSGMDWSTDGQWLAFAAVDPTSGVQNIYKIDRNGANLTQLTATADWDDFPLWSPSGTEILFTRDQSCNFDAWMMNADGTSPRRVTDEQVCDFSLDVLGYDWSPDGQEIVLSGFLTPGDGPLIYKILRTTSAATYFTDRILIGRYGDGSFQVRDIQPSWRP